MTATKQVDRSGVTDVAPDDVVGVHHLREESPAAFATSYALPELFKQALVLKIAFKGKLWWVGGFDLSKSCSVLYDSKMPKLSCSTILSSFNNSH